MYHRIGSKKSKGSPNRIKSSIYQMKSFQYIKTNRIENFLDSVFPSISKLFPPLVTEASVK